MHCAVYDSIILRLCVHHAVACAQWDILSNRAIPAGTMVKPREFYLHNDVIFLLFPFYYSDIVHYRSVQKTDRWNIPDGRRRSSTIPIRLYLVALTP